MSGLFGDSPGKQAVRELWNTPLLRYLHETYGLRYRYLGLPGVDLLDVHLWHDMIDEVVAFEVRAPGDEEYPDGRRFITELRRNLALLPRIRSRAYYGPMEAVVLLGTDLDGLEYRQDHVVTLYNLDFCDEITSLITVPTGGKKLWRFEAIRRILADQRACYERTHEAQLFILLLTIRNQMDAPKLKTFLSQEVYHDTQQYLTACGTVATLPASGAVYGDHTWAMKALLHDTLRRYMDGPNIATAFFPVVKYTGKTTRSPMLHAMLLCRFGPPENRVPSHVPSDYLALAPSIRASADAGLIWEPETGEASAPTDPPSATNWFKSLEPVFLSGIRKVKKRRAAS